VWGGGVGPIARRRRSGRECRGRSTTNENLSHTTFFGSDTDLKGVRTLFFFYLYGLGGAHHAGVSDFVLELFGRLVRGDHEASVFGEREDFRRFVDA